MLTHPLFLIGLVSLAIPVLIHLLQLRRYRKVWFSNVQALQAFQDESRRQNNLRRRLLLAMRLLALLFLVLAFCQPVLPNREGRLQTGGAAVSVYIDNSYSMECGGMEGSLMESAKQKAREIAAAYKPGDQFQLLTNDAAGVQFRWLSREEFLAAVDTLRTSPVTQPLSAMLGRQLQFLAGAASANRQAYCISDFQRTTADFEACADDSLSAVTFVPLGGTEVANIYIDTLLFNSPAYHPGATARLEVRVTNDGDKPVERLPLRLFADGRQRALAAVDVGAHASVTAAMSFVLDDKPLQQGYVETSDYPVTFDDRYYFSLAIDQRIPVLVLGGGQENPYLARLFSGDSLVEYHHAADGAVDYTHLADHRLIVLDELRSIPSGLGQPLQRFVEEGGTLLVLPSAEADRDSYNAFLSSLQAPLLGAWCGERSRVDHLVADHPLFQGVFQGSQEQLELPALTGRYRLEAGASAVAEPVLAMADGGSYLVRTAAGDGALYLFGGPLRKEFTDLVTQALFVPLLYNMALFSTPPQQPCHLLTSAAPIPLRGRYEPEAPPHLVGSGLDAIPTLRRQGGRQFMLPRGELSQAGNYLLGDAAALRSSDAAVLRSSDAAAAEGLSFNYSRRESDLRCHTAAEVRRRLHDAGLKHVSVAAAAQKSMTDYVASRAHGRPLWRWCLLLALLFLAAETVVARISNTSRKSSTTRKQ